MTPDESTLRAFYLALADPPLEPDDPRYVPIHSGPSASSADPVERLARAIRWNPLETVQLFGGFRGTGKSTELRRLRRDLAKDPRFKVVLCDMKQYINLSTPIDVSDFLISVAGALGDALADDGDLLGENVGARSYWQRGIDFLTRTQVQLGEALPGLQGGVGPISLKLGLKQDPSFREVLQDRMKGHLSALVDDVREFMCDCVAALRRKHGEDTQLVVLFDSIEQIRGTTVNEGRVFESIETLFAGHPDKLRFPAMHVVYTVPPWLKIRVPGVPHLYDGGYLLPCVKVRERDGTSHGAGLDVLREIVGRRGDWRQLFASTQDIDHVIQSTGGYLRDLFRVVQRVLMAAAELEITPIGRATIDAELAALRSEYLPISHFDAKWLSRVAHTHDAQLPTHEKLPDLSRYFDTHLLLCYRNGDEWYDIHPLIRDAVEELVSRQDA